MRGDSSPKRPVRRRRPVAERAGPDVLDLDPAEPPVDLLDVVLECVRKPARVVLPGRRRRTTSSWSPPTDAEWLSARSVSRIALERHGELQPAADRSGGHDIGPDGISVRRSVHQLAEMDVAGEHDMVGVKRPLGVYDALAHAGWVHRSARFCWKMRAPAASAAARPSA